MKYPLTFFCIGSKNLYGNYEVGSSTYWIDGLESRELLRVSLKTFVLWLKFDWFFFYFLYLSTFILSNSRFLHAKDFFASSPCQYFMRGETKRKCIFNMDPCDSGTRDARKTLLGHKFHIWRREYIISSCLIYHLCSSMTKRGPVSFIYYLTFLPISSYMFKC